MKVFYKICLLLLLVLNIQTAKNKTLIKEVPEESKETKSVLNIKKFIECVKGIKDIHENLNYLQVLEHKKEYQKQYDYLKRVMPHNKEIMLCRKASRVTVPEYLDVEQFAL